jgi:hypothetical protein
MLCFGRLCKRFVYVELIGSVSVWVRLWAS